MNSINIKPKNMTRVLAIMIDDDIETFNFVYYKDGMFAKGTQWYTPDKFKGWISIPELKELLLKNDNDNEFKALNYLVNNIEDFGEMKYKDNPNVHVAYNCVRMSVANRAILIAVGKDKPTDNIDNNDEMGIHFNDVNI
jgi:hypothetical protein